MAMTRTSQHPVSFYMLGTGGAFCDFRTNYFNNAAVRTSKGWVLIDCGGTAVQSMKELGIHPWEVAGVIVTHIHSDHIGGLEQLGWEVLYTGPDGPGFGNVPLYSTQRILDDVHKSIGPGMWEFTDEQGEIQEDGSNRVFGNHVVGENEEFHIGDMSFTLVPVDHVKGKPSYGVFFGQRGVNVFFTSDMVFQPDLVKDYAKKSLLVMHDCTFSSPYYGTVHTHYSELQQLPFDVRRKVILMHHTRVPEDVDVQEDGFLYAADRHDFFACTYGQVSIGRGDEAVHVDLSRKDTSE